MDMKVEGRRITFSKELNKLDRMAVSFSRSLTLFRIEHVFLSGYVAILFGRNRASEDIDVICRPISFDQFSMLWDDIHKTFECIITSDKQYAFEGYLMEQSALRFAYPGKVIPNIEFKFGYTELHKRALTEKLDVNFEPHHLPISPLEQQIAYKLFMASEKDIEDARFLFKLFEETIDTQILRSYLEALKVSLPFANKYLGWVHSNET